MTYPDTATVTAHRRQLLALTDTLLDPSTSPGEQREATQEWFRWAMGILGIPEETDPGDANEAFNRDSNGGTGKAIDPRSAARCVWEYTRTAKFLRGVDAAIQAAITKFPDETILVLEAGCGPLATLSLPFALRYPAERVKFSLLDLHPISLDCADRLIRSMGIEDSFQQRWCTDAATFTIPAGNRPHIVICEVLQRALTTEPQVAVTQNLLPQLRPGGFWLPQRIDVMLGTFDSAAHFNRSLTTATEERPAPPPALVTLGLACSLDATVSDGATPGNDGKVLRCGEVVVPIHHYTRNPLNLLTHLHIFGEQHLGNFESSLNLPQKFPYPAEIAERGGKVVFEYRINRDPGPEPRFSLAPPSLGS